LSKIVGKEINMQKSVVELLFDWFDHTTLAVSKELDEPYLESLAYAMELLFHQEVPEYFSEMTKHKLQKLLTEEIVSSAHDPLHIRKAVQLAILKGMKGQTQQQHLMTPETVALLVGYLAEKLMNKRETVRLFDPACGTANLLTTVMSHLSGKNVTAFASEVDPTLIRLGVAHANLLEMDIEFFQQDSLRPFLIDPVDLIVADLPVGYYPDDVQADKFELKAAEGHSYAHHLFIEQSLYYTKESSYAIFIVPHFLFDSDQSDQLHQYLQKYTEIVSVIQLPESAFVSKEQAKSILVVRKKGEHTQPIRQPMFVNMPSFSDTLAMEDILTQMNDWFKTNEAIL